jgi:hypothetical protein
MSTKAPAAKRVKELEGEVIDLNMTIQAQSEEIVNQLNTIISLRKQLAIASANGSSAETDEPDPKGEE